MTLDSRNVRLYEATWPEIAERLSQGWVSVLVPLGATEQHGYHLPLSTDCDIAAAVAERAAKVLGYCFVTPTIPIGCSDHHMGFSGSMTFAEDTLVAVLHDVCRSMARHGFKNVFLTSGHAGNVPAMRRALSEMQGASLACRVEGLVDWGRYRDPLYAIAERHGLTRRRAGSHGGHYETSVMRRLRSDLVHMERSRPGLINEPDLAGRALRAQGMAAISPDGVIGDPTSATEAAGEEYLQAMTQTIVTAFQEAFVSSETAAN